jgi:hypothetical protein
VRASLDAPRKLLAKPSLTADISRGRPDGRHRHEAVVIHFRGLNQLATLGSYRDGRRVGAERLDVGRAWDAANYIQKLTLTDIARDDLGLRLIVKPVLTANPTHDQFANI